MTDKQPISFAISGVGMIADYHHQAITANADQGAKLVAGGITIPTALTKPALNSACPVFTLLPAPSRRKARGLTPAPRRPSVRPHPPGHPGGRFWRVDPCLASLPYHRPQAFYDQAGWRGTLALAAVLAIYRAAGILEGN